MPLKTFTIDFADISKQEFLRLDTDYRYFFDVQNASVYEFDRLIKLKYVLNELPTQKVSKGDLEDEELLIDIGNIERRYNNLINIEKVTAVGSDKNIIQDGDIVIPKLQPQMGNIFLNTKHNKFIGSSELIEYSISKNYDALFLYYLLISKKFLSDLAKLESGKTHKRVNPDDLLKIKIPLIPKQTQDRIVAEIEGIEHTIQALKASIQTPQNIINAVFAHEFGFDLEQFEHHKKEKFFEVEFAEFSKHRDLRFGIGVRKARIELKPFITKQYEYLPLSKIISLEYGTGLTEHQRIEGVYPVMGANGVVGYHNEFLIKGPSIIIGRKGSAGEVNYIEENNYPIDTCFYVKFLKKQNTMYFSYLLKFLHLSRLTLFKGVPGLNRYDVYDIKIPRIPLPKQQRIVDEIKAQLDKQETIKTIIEKERNKIDKIITHAIQ